MVSARISFGAFLSLFYGRFLYFRRNSLEDTISSIALVWYGMVITNSYQRALVEELVLERLFCVEHIKIYYPVTWFILRNKD